MLLKNWGARLVLGLVLFSAALACRTSDVFVAQATISPTRTVRRPTFTPMPTDTNTPEPTATEPPTAVPSPTRKPAAPRPKPTNTKPPPPPPAATQPPKPAYQYSVYAYSCEHSGGSWLKGHVYADINDKTSAVPGLGVDFGSSGGDVYGSGETDGNGDYAFTLTADGRGAKIGTFYIWLTDGSGNRISEMAGPININGKPAEAPDTCWAGWGFFQKNY